MSLDVWRTDPLPMGETVLLYLVSGETLAGQLRVGTDEVVELTEAFVVREERVTGGAQSHWARVEPRGTLEIPLTSIQGWRELPGDFT